MTPIVQAIQEELPKDAKISDISYEGSEIILYTKNKDFFKESTGLIKRIVNKIKKRIEVRADPSIILDEEETREFIKKVVPAEAGIKDIYFEKEFAKVVIHAEKPGLVIGKSGETLLAIKKTTYWTPDIKRAPVIESEIIRSIRKMHHKEAGYRKKFLNALGEKIYTPSKEIEWIRVTGLGAFREVGRSCIFLQTNQSKVLMDCGLSVSAAAASPFPYLDAPEFRIQDLDAIILSHAHMDHCLPPNTPVVMADGSTKPISGVSEGDKVLSMNFQTGELEAGTCSGKTSTTGHKEIRQIKTPFRTIEASPNHRFFTVRNLEVTEVEAQDLRIGELLPTTSTKEDNNIADINLTIDVNYDPRRQDNVMLPSILNEKLASLIGYIQGDGHRSSGFSMRLTDSNKNLLEFYQNSIEDLFSYKPILRPHSDKTKNAWILEINNIKIIRFLESNFPGLLDKSTSRKLPQKILSSNKKIKSAYLRGLMDAEGTVIIKMPVIKFTSYSEELLNGVKSLMLEIGVPTTLDKKYNTLRISSLHGIRTFTESIGFNCISKKEKMLRLARTSQFEKDVVPITSADLRTIISHARLIGRIHNSPKFRKKLGLYDWLNRDSSSYCTRRTAASLLELLESRTDELNQMKSKLEENNLKDVRQGLTLSLSSLADQTGIQKHMLGYRENGYVDAIHQTLSNALEEKLVQTIEVTQENIEKIRKIINLSVQWEEIREINTLQNPYSELIDIEVLPHKNFVAQGIVVHNCGMVPYLYEYGFRGPLYCTRPTLDLAAMLQLDYLQICQRENKKAPYTSKAIEETIKHAVPLEYNEVSDITPDMRLTLNNAGHILGSSVCHVHIGDGLYNVLYTGDIKYEKTKLFEKTSADFTRAETVIIEGTYGGNEDVMTSHLEGEHKLVDVVKRTISRGGRILIPCFAVGRSQDVIAILADSDIDCPIYLDGMLWDATAIHTAYPEFLAQNIQTQILHKSNNPFIDPRLHGIGSGQERQKVFNTKEPCVVLSTSGMLMGGPAIEYLKNFSDNPLNTLLFVGYQAEGTPGRRIQKGWKDLQLENGVHLNLKLEIDTVRGLGGHSDQKQMLAYLRHLKNKPRKVIIDHCENSKCVEFARTIHSQLRVESIAPKNLETIRLK